MWPMPCRVQFRTHAQSAGHGRLGGILLVSILVSNGVYATHAGNQGPISTRATSTTIRLSPASALALAGHWVAHMIAEATALLTRALVLVDTISTDIEVFAVTRALHALVLGEVALPARARADHTLLCVDIITTGVH